MPDVRLHRTEEQRTLRIAALPVHRPRSPHLHRVAELRPRAVRLQVIHLRGPNPGPRQRVPDHPLLRRTVGHREPRARPILVHRRAEQHSQDPVPLPFRIRKALQDHHPAPLAPHEAVRRSVERLAPSVRRHQPRLREDLCGLREQDRAHAPGQRDVRLPLTERRGRLVHGHQGRRTRRVHGDRRAGETQRERHPPHRRRTHDSRHPVEALRGVIRGRRRQDRVVVVRTHGAVHPGPGPPETSGGHARVLERLPARLEEQPLLWVQHLRFQRGNPEKLRVEAVHPLQVRTERPVRLRLRVHEQPIRPPPGHRETARKQQVPERRETFASREPAGHPHDRHLLLFPEAHRRQRRRGPLHRRAFLQGARQMPRQPRRIGIVEHRRVRHRQRVPESPVQAVPELHRHQRVHPQLEEPGIRRGGRTQPQHRDEFVQEEPDELRFPLRDGKPQEPSRQVLGGNRRALRLRRGQLAEPRRNRSDKRPVHRSHQARRRVLRDEPRQGPDPLLRRDRFPARRRPPAGVPLPRLPASLNVRPRFPRDGLTGKPEPPAMPRQLLQERARRREARLTRPPDDPRRAAAEDEQVQLAVPRRPVETPRAQRLRPQLRFECPPVETSERPVRRRAHTVDQPAERGQVPLQPREHRRERLRVRQVARLHPYVRTILPEGGDLRLRRRSRRPPAAQHDGPRSRVHEPPRRFQSHPPQVARHQIAPVSAHPQTRRRGLPGWRLLVRKPDQTRHPPLSAPPRHPRFPIRPRQFVRQRGGGAIRPRIVLRVQVHQPQIQFAPLRRHRGPEPPERRARKRPCKCVCRFRSERLSPPGNEPHARTGANPRVREPLDEPQRPRTERRELFPQLGAGRLRIIGPPPSEIRHAAQRRRRRQRREERTPRLPVPLGGPPESLLPPASQFRLNLRPEHAAARQHEESRFRRRLHGALRHDHRLAFPRLQELRLPIPRVRQGATPRLRARQRIVRPVRVGETPPARQQPEGQVQPALRRRPLDQHQQTRRRQQHPAVRERFPQVLGRVQHVRRQDQVVLVLREALLLRIALDVQHPVPHRRRPLREPLLRGSEQRGRDVREVVLRKVGGQHRKHRLRRRPGPRAHLQDAQPAPIRESGHRRRHRLPREAVHGQQAGGPRVEVLSPRLLAEHQLQGVRPAPQHLRERRAATPQHLLLHRERGPVGSLAPGRQRVPATQPHRPGARRTAVHQPCLGKHRQKPLEEPPMVSRHLQLPPEFVRLERVPRRPLPTEFLEPREGEPPRLPGEGVSDRRPLLRIHPVRRGPQRPRQRRRTQQEPGVRDPRRRGRTPLHRVHGRLDALPGERRTARPLQGEPEHPAQRPALGPVELQVRSSRFPRTVCRSRGRVPDPGPAEKPLRQRSREPQPLPAEGEPGFALLDTVHKAGDPREYLETPVQQRRVRPEGGMGAFPGQHYLPESARSSRPQPGNHPECRTAANPGFGQPTVEIRR